MANRSDFNSVLPRQIKKWLSLITDPHERAEWRKLWISAHAAHKAAVQRRRASTEMPIALMSELERNKFLRKEATEPTPQ